MHYTKFGFKDYRHDTRGLDPAAHGIYLLLLFEFMESEKPLPVDLDDLCCLCEARTTKEQEIVKKILRKFWLRLEDGWIQKLAFIQILDYRNGAAVKKSNAQKIKGVAKTKLETGIAKRTLGEILAKCQRTGSDPLADYYIITSESLAVLVNQESGIINQESGTKEPPTTPPTGGDPGREAAEAWAMKFNNSEGIPLGLNITGQLVQEWHDDRTRIGWVTIRGGTEVPIRAWQADLRDFARMKSRFSVAAAITGKKTNGGRFAFEDAGETAPRLPLHDKEPSWDWKNLWRGNYECDPPAWGSAAEDNRRELLGFLKAEPRDEWRGDAAVVLPAMGIQLPDDLATLSWTSLTDAARCQVRIKLFEKMKGTSA